MLFVIFWMATSQKTNLTELSFTLVDSQQRSRNVSDHENIDKITT